MKLSRVLCYFGSHDLTQWRSVPGRDYTKLIPLPPPPHLTEVSQFGNPVNLVSTPLTGPLNERHCKRTGCKYQETKRVRAKAPRRPANTADTIQGANNGG